MNYLPNEPFFFTFPCNWSDNYINQIELIVPEATQFETEIWKKVIIK